MIGFISGRVINISDNLVLIENNGIGYEVACSAQAIKNFAINQDGAVYTYLAVREDGMYLYGFSSLEEKSMFLKLITVSGVGPKMGITILSGMSLSDLALNIATQNVKALSSVKGLGKKTAERIILELREKITQEGLDSIKKDDATSQNTTEIDQDAIIALMGLGFTRAESISALKVATENGAKTIEQMITFALKNIGK